MAKSEEPRPGIRPGFQRRRQRAAERLRSWRPRLGTIGGASGKQHRAAGPASARREHGPRPLVADDVERRWHGFGLMCCAVVHGRSAPVRGRAQRMLRWAPVYGSRYDCQQCIPAGSRTRVVGVKGRCPGRWTTGTYVVLAGGERGYPAQRDATPHWGVGAERWRGLCPSRDLNPPFPG